MKNKLFKLITITLFFFINEVNVSAQRYIHDYPLYSESFIKNIIKIDTTFYGVTFSESPKLLLFNRLGIIIKEVDISLQINRVLCIKENEGRIFIGGYSGTSFSNKSMLITINLEGQILSTREYELQYISSIYFHDTGIYLGGRFKQNGSSRSSGLLKISKSGEKEWIKGYQIYSYSQTAQITELNGELYLLHYCNTVGTGFTGFRLNKVNYQDGTVIKSIDVETGYFDGYDNFDRSLSPLEILTSDNKIYVMCAGESYGTGSGIFIFDKNLELVNTIKLSKTSVAYHPFSVFITENSILISGYSQSGNEKNGFIRKISKTGELEWHKNLNNNFVHSLILDGEYIYGAGSKNVYNSELPFHPLFLRISSDGKVYNTNTQLSLSEISHCDSLVDFPSKEFALLTINGSPYTILSDNLTPLDLPEGKYPVSYTPPIGYEICNIPDTISIRNDNDTINLKLINLMCSDIICGITVNELVRGTDYRFNISVQNRGTEIAYDIYVNLKSNLSLENLTSSFEFKRLSDNEIEMFIDSIGPKEQKIFPLDLFIEFGSTLFSKYNMKVKLSSMFSCNSEFQEYVGSDLQIAAICDKDSVLLSIKNEGATMADFTTLNVHKDGYLYENINLKLDSLENFTKTYYDKGSAFGFVVKELLENTKEVYEAVTIEGCGSFPNDYFSKGINNFSQNSNITFWESECNMEVLDHRNGNIIFQINKGQGYYRYINDNVLFHEYSIRYINDENQIVSNVVISLDLSSDFDPISFVSLAGSHTSQFNIKGNQVIIEFKNLALMEGEQIQLRFGIKTYHQPNQNSILVIGANGIINNNFNVEFKPAFNNIKNQLVKNNQSPYPYTNVGQILGKHDAIDFFTAMEVFNDESKMLVSTYIEPGGEYITVITKISNTEKVQWEKSYAFKEGGSVVSNILKLDEDNILLFGRVDDKNLPINYLGDGYTLIFCVNQNGDMKWKKIWRFDEINKRTGNISYVHKGESEIFFSGEMLTSQGYKYYYSSIDINGLVGEVKILEIQGNLLLAEDNNSIIFFGGYTSGVPFDHNFIVLSKDGKELFTGKINYNDLKHSIIDIILNDDNLYLLGQYYSNSLSKYVSSISNYNLNTQILVKSDIKNIKARHFSPTHFRKTNDGYLVSGEMAIDTTFNLDVGLVKIDTNGFVIWENNQDFGSREYAQGIISKNNKIYIPFQTQASDDIYNLQFGYYLISEPNVSGITEDVHHDILVYPNPTTGILNIDSRIFKFTRFSIYNIMGIEVGSGDFNNDMYIDVNNLGPGQYVLKLMIGNTQSFNFKFIKQ